MLTVHQQRTKLYPKRNFMNEILFIRMLTVHQQRTKLYPKRNFMNEILFITHADSSPTENKTISKA